MNPTIPDREPTVIQAGDTLLWSRSFPDYPPSAGWTLKYAFRGVGSFDISAEDDGSGNGYIVLVPAATSAVAAGLYEWVAWVENTADPVEKHSVASGRVIVRPQLSTTAAGTRQQHAERMVALIEAQLEQLAASPVETYTIEQQTTVRRKMLELEGTRARYKAELRRLNNRGRMTGYSAVFRR